MKGGGHKAGRSDAARLGLQERVSKWASGLANRVGAGVRLPGGGGTWPARPGPSRLGSVIDALASVRARLSARSLVGLVVRSATGLEPVVHELRAGRSVVLATLAEPRSLRAVTALATRLRKAARGDSPPLVVIALVNESAASTSSEVRLFGQPAELSDQPARLALALHARLFPTFVCEAPLLGAHVSVDSPIRARGSSDLDIQRTGQRIAWSLERFMRENPSSWSHFDPASLQRPRLPAARRASIAPAQG